MSSRPFDPWIHENEQSVREVLRRFTYRPGWIFEVHDSYLKVYATVVDANNPTEEIPLVFGRAIPRHPFQHFDWTRWLFEQIREIELHEAQEFFRIDGVPVYDPHPELRDR